MWMGNILKNSSIGKTGSGIWGRDIIKADPTDEVDAYHKVVEIAGSIPVLVRGGGRAGDEEILNRNIRFNEAGR